MGQYRAAGRVQSRRRLQPVPESARAAREAVLGALAAAGRDDLADAASLLVSELVTNAIVHARTPIDLDVVAGAAGLRVAVRDESSTMPAQRHYGRSATTGRGLGLVEMMSDRHGTDSNPDNGKTVWFELGAMAWGRDVRPTIAANTADHAPDPLAPVPVAVRLERLPVALARAWQQHADALLREYTLSQWDEDAHPAAAPADDAAAHDAFAVLAAAIDEVADTDPRPEYADVTIDVPRDQASRFADLGNVLEHVLGLAERGLTLAPPTQPEIRSFRRWLIVQVRDQVAGQPPEAWSGLESTLEASAGHPVAWDDTAVRTATDAVVAADDLNRIIAASPAALDLLGWDGDLLGRRIVTVIPRRFRETHIAAFTLNLLTGEGRIIDREVTVPALRRDGTEVEIVLVVHREPAGEGRTVFTASMRLP